MIKIKFMHYDATEYKVLLHHLEVLAKAGYTCKSIDTITIFKKDYRKIHYHTAIFHSTASTQFSKQEEKRKWLENYTNHHYTYLGHIKNIYTFTCKQPDPTFENSNTKQTYITFHMIKKLILLVLLLVLLWITVPSLWKNNGINLFTTDGAILLYCIPPLLGIALLIRFISNLFFTWQLKKAPSPDTIAYKNTKKQTLFHKVFYLLLSLCILLTMAGLLLDNFQREKQTTSSILTMHDILQTSKNPQQATVITKHSVLIPTSYRYLMQEKENILSVNYYACNKKATATYFLHQFLNRPKSIQSKRIVPLPAYPHVYIGFNTVDDQANAMLILKDRTIILIATSFDLTNPQYQKAILSYFMKR